MLPDGNVVDVSIVILIFLSFLSATNNRLCNQIFIFLSSLAINMSYV